MSIYDARIIELNRDGSSRDAIIIILVTEFGISINAATKAYAAVAKAQGWTTAIVSHKADALIGLGDVYPTADFWDAQAVKDAIVDMAANYGIAESTARDYAKAYSELLGVDHPVLDPRAAMFAWLVENAEYGTKAEFKEFAGQDGLGRSDSNVNEYWKGMELHRAIVAASE
jgi:hypothetical protein